MAAKGSGTRQALILAGIDEISAHGATEFSVRRVAQACHVSCAAPYKHFKDKREFIAAIIDHVNEQWAARQEQVLAACGESLRQQIVAVSVAYVRFLMENPCFRAVLMLKDKEFDNIYHKKRGRLSSRSQQLERAFFSASGMDAETQQRKLQLVRALIFGTVFLFDTGELVYGEQALEHLRYNIDREFDLP